MATRNRAWPDWLISTFTDDLLFKLISLMVAVFTWAWVQSGLIDEQRVRAEVHILWPTELVRANDVPTTLVLSVEGPKGALSQLNDSRPVITVDATALEEGENTLDFSLHPISGLPPDTRAVAFTPPTAMLTLEKRSSRELPVKPMVTGAPADGFRLVSVKVTPTRVKVTGPRSAIRKLEEAATDLVDLSGIRESRTVSVPLSFSAPAVGTADNKPVQVQVQVEAIRAERHFSDVLVVASAPGWLASPGTAKVTLDGPINDLNAVQSPQVRIAVSLPDPPPDGPIVITQGTGPGHFAVMHGDSAEVTVRDVEPSTFTLEREDP